MAQKQAQDPVVITLGCRLNFYESALMKQHARHAGLTQHVFIHSCAVTAEAVRQSRQAVRRARRRYPEARLVVTGCAAHIHTDEFAAMDEVDDVIDNTLKLKAGVYHRLREQQHEQRTTQKSARVWQARPQDTNSTADARHPLLEDFFGRARGFVSVQEGCDHKCTFCIIPQGRGAHRSVEPQEVARRCLGLVAQGCEEIVLSGVDIASWGQEWNGSLGDLVAFLLQRVEGLTRLRLSSLDPARVDDALLDCFTSDRMMPVAHLSVQAGDDMILKRMKRRHRRRDVLRLCDKLRARRADMVFGADMIAGFPTEDETMHRNSCLLLQEANLVLNHIFPYSPRLGTPAARMPMVPVETRKVRAARLRRHSQALLHDTLDALVNKQVDVLIEDGQKGIGRSEHALPVQFQPNPQFQKGRRPMTIRSHQQGILQAAATL